MTASIRCLSYRELRRGLRFASVVAVLCVAMIATGERSWGALLITDNFESYSPVNTAGNLDPPWIYAGTGVPPSEDAYASNAAQSPIKSSPTDDRSGLLVGTALADRPVIARSLTGLANDETLYVQFDFMVVETGAWNPSFQLRGTGDLGLGVNLHMTGNTTGGQNYDVAVNQGSGFANLDTVLAPETWYRFTLTVAPADSTDDSFALRIQSLIGDGVDDTYASLGFQNDLTAFTTVDFRFNTNQEVNAGQYFIDNLVLTTNPDDLNFAIVPEPGNFALAGVAGVAALLGCAVRRRCRAAAHG